MTDEFRDFYALLNVTFDATFDEIKSAYRGMAKRYHPDLNPEDPDESAVRFRLIHDAYQLLSDPSKRRQYDREWQRFRNFEEPPEPPGPALQVSVSDWEFACRYYPALRIYSERLKNFSETVENRWRNRIFFEKAFPRSDELARSAEEAFLGKLVGASEVLRMVAKDALLLPHDALLAELANALRVFGPTATEQLIAKICADTINVDDDSIPDDFYGDPFRIEIYRNEEIKVLSNLMCRVGYNKKLFHYVFEARNAIDAYIDKNQPIDPPPSANRTRNRRS